MLCRFSLTCSHNHTLLSLLTFCCLPKAVSPAVSSSSPKLQAWVCVSECERVHTCVFHIISECVSALIFAENEDAESAASVWMLAAKRTVRKRYDVCACESVSMCVCTC